LSENYLDKYISSFIQNPTLYAIPLTATKVKEFGVTNNKFWKNFIVNIDCHDGKTLSNEGLYDYLAKIYFVTIDKKKMNLLEKLPSRAIKDWGTVDRLSENLKQQDVIVDIKNASLIDEKLGKYKFSKYQIIENSKMSVDVV
jgi:hypothetical protein